MNDEIPQPNPTIFAIISSVALCAMTQIIAGAVEAKPATKSTAMTVAAFIGFQGGKRLYQAEVGKHTERVLQERQKQTQLSL